MLFSNIKGRKLPVLEQACERYALMAYEVFWNEVAYGFKSIKFSYEDSDTPGRGTFTATFTSFTKEWWEKGREPIITKVIFSIADQSLGRDKSWVLSDGKVIVNTGAYAGSHQIRFADTCYNIAVIVPNSGNPDMLYVYHVGTGPNPRICNSQALPERRFSDYGVIV